MGIKGQRQYAYDNELDPYVNLAGAIIFRAMTDAAFLKRRGGGWNYSCGSDITYHELNRFFESEWCAKLCNLAGITGDDLKRRAGLA